MRRRRVWLAVLAVTALSACSPPADTPRFEATDITGATFARSLQLTGHDGGARTLSDFRGQVVVVFFGFTHCPDVCPGALARLKAALGLLGENARRVQVLLVTVDPERDTPPVLREYLGAFHPSFLGLTGTPADIAKVAKEFRVLADRQPAGADGNYTVDHSAAMYVFDPQGRVRLYVAPAQSPKAIAADIALLLGGR